MANERPNIILIVTDQQRYDTIAALGFPHVDTPNIDRLVNEGVAFTNCFTTAPSCAPARASLFSGYYPHTTGVFENENIWQHSWVEDLSKSGYYCVNIGKMHTFPYETPLGFHERYVVENKDRGLEQEKYLTDRWEMALRAQKTKKQDRDFYRTLSDYKERIGAFEWNMPEDTHSDFFVGDMACWWLRNKPKTKPLFMQIGFPGPHPPYDPVPRYAEPYLKRELPLPVVTQEELDAQPPALKKLREHNCQVDHDAILWSENPTKEQLHRMVAYYLANMTMIDEKIGEFIRTMEETGYLENSVIIFMSDHGDALGNHGQTQKWLMYDEATKVPMVVWSPGRYSGGRKIDHLCQNFDIAPVIMEIAGIKPPHTWEAISLVPFLKEESDASIRDYVFSEQVQDSARLAGIIEQITMVRSKEFKLVHYLGDDEYGELYDLRVDPGELVNLWSDPAYEADKNRLLGELLKWLMRSNAHTADYPIPLR